MKKIVGLICTNGRFSYLERALACFLKQDYENKELLIYNNAEVAIKMKPEKNVTLINNHIDYVTQKPYADVGSIFRDAITHIESTADYVSIMDDDDIYLPNHFSRGVSSLNDHPDYKVWKPGYFFFKGSPYEVEYLPAYNNLEPACIIDYAFLKECGFEIGTSLTYHFTWLETAKNKNIFYFEEENKIPTYCYEFGQENIVHISCFSVYHPELNRLDINEQLKKIGNLGEGKVLTPWDDKKLQLLYDVYLNLDNFS